MNIYVSNLDNNITEEELRKLFAEHGVINSVKIITDYNTGRSRGFAFVEMDNETDGNKAIESLNGFSLQNRNIAVQLARPKEDRPKKSAFNEKNSFWKN